MTNWAQTLTGLLCYALCWDTTSEDCLVKIKKVSSVLKATSTLFFRLHKNEDSSKLSAASYCICFVSSFWSFPRKVYNPLVYKGKTQPGLELRSWKGKAIFILQSALPLEEILKLMGNFWRGTQVKTRGNEGPLQACRRFHKTLPNLGLILWLRTSPNPVL